MRRITKYLPIFWIFLGGNSQLAFLLRMQKLPSSHIHESMAAPRISFALFTLFVTAVLGADNAFSSFPKQQPTVVGGKNSSIGGESDNQHDERTPFLRGQGPSIPATVDPTEPSSISSYRIGLQYNGNFFHGPIYVEGIPYEVVFSFESSSIWLFGSGAMNDIGEDGFVHTYYKKVPEKDDDKGDDDRFKVEYLDGSKYSGTTTQETVDIGGSGITPGSIKVVMGIVDQFSKGEDENPAWTNMDGVVGLGIKHYKDNEHVPRGQIPVIHKLISRYSIDPRFSVHLANDGRSGEMLIGQEDHSLYSGSLTYASVLSGNPGWVVTLGAFMMGDKRLAKNVPIEVNLASNSLWAPRPYIQSIIDLTKGAATWDDENAHVIIDCTKRAGLPKIAFKFGEDDEEQQEFLPEEYFPEFTVPGYRIENRRCTLFMMPSDELPAAKSGSGVHPEQLWSLGIPFFKKYYSVFERGYGGVWQVGFALGTHDEEEL